MAPIQHRLNHIHSAFPTIQTAEHELVRVESEQSSVCRVYSANCWSLKDAPSEAVDAGYSVRRIGMNGDFISIQV
jgi:hypothetical protein